MNTFSVNTFQTNSRVLAPCHEEICPVGSIHWSQHTLQLPESSAWPWHAHLQAGASNYTLTLAIRDFQKHSFSPSFSLPLPVWLLSSVILLCGFMVLTLFVFLTTSISSPLISSDTSHELACCSGFVCYW